MQHPQLFIRTLYSWAFYRTTFSSLQFARLKSCGQPSSLGSISALCLCVALFFSALNITNEFLPESGVNDSYNFQGNFKREQTCYQPCDPTGYCCTESTTSIFAFTIPISLYTQFGFNFIFKLRKGQDLPTSKSGHSADKTLLTTKSHV